MRAHCSILLVEDDDGIRDSVAECLASEGYAVRQATNGVEALAELRRGGRPDAMLVDLVMPQMDGGALIESVRADPALRDIPIVLMTAAMPTPTTALPPADGYLDKPFQLDDLLAAVAHHCGAVAA